jgi:hypothetical protein
MKNYKFIKTSSNPLKATQDHAVALKKPGNPNISKQKFKNYSTANQTN